MNYKLIPVCYEEDPSSLLRFDIPDIDILATARFDSRIYLLLLSTPSAARLQDYLMEDVVPPMTRRYMARSKSYAPGFVFDFDAKAQTAAGVASLAQAYRSLSYQLRGRNDQAFSLQPIERVDEQQSSGQHGPNLVHL